MTFEADFPGAIVVEAATWGYPSHVRGNNDPKAVGLHTPEEPADENPSTPYYFHNLTGRNASTTYFDAWTGFIFQCVPEDAGAYGQGRDGVPGHFDWEDPDENLNLQSISIEIEGYARNIHETMPRGSPQWVSLVRLMADICRRRGIPAERTFGHYQVSIYRSDPGKLDIGALVEDVNALLGGVDMALSPEYQAKLELFLDRVATSRDQAPFHPGGEYIGIDVILEVLRYLDGQHIPDIKAAIEGISTGGVDVDALAAKVADLLAERLKE